LALATAGIRRVVVGLRDPNPLVRGRGIAHLRRSGVEVLVGLLADETRRMNEAYVLSCREQRPFVLLKVATTLDGRIATSGGDSKWITSDALRNEARRLRGRYDAVLVGVGTALADDPLLLPRPRPRRAFLRVVLDSTLRLPVTGQLARTAHASPVLVICTNPDPIRRRQLAALGVEVVVLPGRGRVSVGAVVEELGRRGLRSVMVEGGSELLGSFVAERLFDKLVLYRAPLVLGGRNSRPAFGGPDPVRIAEAVPLVPGPPDGAAEVWYPRRLRKRARQSEKTRSLSG
jgi:diaminohydroxyphosphoribosylaminopyrimidine deaminase/5-amino-6-(5-phosphoribosylamino)uracil reductase